MGHDLRRPHHCAVTEPQGPQRLLQAPVDLNRLLAFLARLQPLLRPRVPCYPASVGDQWKEAEATPFPSARFDLSARGSHFHVALASLVDVQRWIAIGPCRICEAGPGQQDEECEAGHGAVRGVARRASRHFECPYQASLERRGLPSDALAVKRH